MKKVAVKIMEKRRICEMNDQTRVNREIAILKAIKHPNVIQLHEIIESESAIYMIMEYAPGGELFNYIVEKDRLTEAEAQKFFY